ESATRRASRRLRIGAPPGVVPVEGLLEVEEPDEVLDAILRLGHQDSGLHEGEDDLAEVRRRVDPPVLEDGPGEGAELVDRERTGALREFRPGDMARLLELRDHLVE